MSQGPLVGLRVLDLSTVFAGPFCGALLGDFGAEVIKVELPGIGDPLRALPPHKDDVSLWSKVTNRNKRHITLDLRRPEARNVLARLLPTRHVVIENFRPGTLDGWGLTGPWMRSFNPRLTILRMTGFGQNGPYRDRPGFARAFEARARRQSQHGKHQEYSSHGRPPPFRWSFIRLYRRPGSRRTFGFAFTTGGGEQRPR